jgi:hypothetical protein
MNEKLVEHILLYTKSQLAGQAQIQDNIGDNTQADLYCTAG